MEEMLTKQKNIGFSGAGASYQNGSAERATKTVVTMARTMLMHAALICTEETLSTDIWPTEMDYAVCIYNRIPDIQYGLYAIKIWSRSRFETVLETLSNLYVWRCPAYFLEQKLQNPVVKIPKWNPRSKRGFNTGFRNMH